ncbi:MAG: DNA polymerase I [Culicoidibacterales bacterium]
MKLILVDGNALLFRAFYATAYSGAMMKNRDGVHTNAIFGFVNMMQKIIADHEYTHLLVAFDAAKKNFRHDQYPEYKGTRKSAPEEIVEQFALAREYLVAANIHMSEVEGYEADDIIGTLTKQAEAQNYQVEIITGDRDLLQLVSEQTVVRLTKKGLSELDTYSPATIYEQYQLEPRQIIDLKGLMGDSSDNIPGVPGVGEKTALKFLHKYGSVETLYEHIDEIKGKIQEKLIANQDLATLSKQLATIHTEVPLTYTIEELRHQTYNTAALIQFYQKVDFHSFIRKLELEQASQQAPQPDVEFAIDDLLGGIDELIPTPTPVLVTRVPQALLVTGTTIYVEMPALNYHIGEAIGIALVNEQKHVFINMSDAVNDSAFCTWLADETQAKSTFDVKKVIVALASQGLAIQGVTFDMLLAAYVLNPSYASDEVATVAAVKQYDVPYDEQVYGKGAKFAVPELEVVAEHAIKKAQAIYQLKEQLLADLRVNQQYDLFATIELPVALILAKMEIQGITVNKTTLKTMEDEIELRIQALEVRIHELAGENFNIASPKQLSVILFEKLGLPVIKKTKTGYSTAVDVLEKLQMEHPIIEEILRYRQLTKLQSTYVKGLATMVLADGKIHTIYRQTLAQTGRLSSIEPNLQNIPIRLEEGRLIRKAFEASPGNVLLAADYSQIELRVLAHIAQVEALIEAFTHGEDIHTATAKKVFQVEEVTSEMRRRAKAVNFGIIYGISDFGLAQQLKISRYEAKSFIEQYFEIFPGIQAYMKETIEFGKTHGYVETLLHRKRYVPELKSRNFNERSAGERAAMNAPIQGSAADIMKLAMVAVDQAMQAAGVEAKMLLQVHDELIFDVPTTEVELMTQLVTQAMENVLALAVPLKVDSDTGVNWYETK